MDTLLQDLRQTIRRLSRAPAFALTAVVTLAVGIGATTAIFSVVNGVLLRSLPYPEPDRLVATRWFTSYMNLQDILAWSKSYDSGGGYVPHPLDLVGNAEPLQVPAALVTGSLFRTLGIEALRGRTLMESDDLAGAARVVVVSHGFWKRHFGGQATALGRSLTLSGDAYTVVGIMPPGFVLPQVEADVFTPVNVVFPEATTHRGVNFLRICLRLAPGVTLAQAGHELKAIGRRLEQVAPEENKGRNWEVLGLLDRMVGGVRTALWVLLGAVTLALLVACTNFANLLLARSVARAHELAVRSSLGAGRGHLVRQMLSESLVLALVGGAFGVMLAAWGVDLLLALEPADLPRLSGIRVDAAVLAFAAALSIVTGVVFGLIPALHASGRAAAEALKQGATSTVSGTGARRLLGTLVVSQIALALLLLIGAGLLLNGFWRLRSVQPGFDARDALTLRLELPEARYHDRASQNLYQDRLVEALAAVPGSEAALVSEVPLSGDALDHNFIIQGRPPIPIGEEPDLFSRSVAGDYFGVMRIPIRVGRGLLPEDRAGAPLVGVINESMARQYFPDQNPIGQRIRWARAEGPPQWIGIVGVAADVRHFGLEEKEYPAIYTPYAQFSQNWKRWMHVVVRSREGEGSLTRRLKTAIWSVDPAIPITRVQPLDAVVASSMSQRRFHLFLLCCFAGVALILAALGIYGVTSYGVNRRTREIGLRMALGASNRDVYWLVVLGGLRFVVIGIVAGVAGALALTRLLASLLYEVRPTDPLTYLAVAVALAAVALVACAVPAGRAARLDPIEALRSE